MKKKRLVVIVAVALAGFCLTFGGIAILPSGPGVTKKNFDQLEIGMTQDEVNAIFGPPGWHKDPPGYEVVTWHGDHGTAKIVFGHERQVLEKSWTDREMNRLDSLRLLIGWKRPPRIPVEDF